MSKVFYPFDVLLPKKKYDISKWAVIEYDQYTADPSYWNMIAKEVGDNPSTLNLIVPECI